MMSGVLDLDILYTQLPPEIKASILSLTTILTTGVHDYIVCKGSLDGNYTASVGYRWHIKKISPLTTPSLSWNWIWKAALPEKNQNSPLVYVPRLSSYYNYA